MGLDNMPHRYPCERLGTAIKVDIIDKEGNPLLDDATGLPEKRIDCEATIKAELCPYVLAKKKSGTVGGEVYGILGTECWYRGKYGNYLLEALGIHDNESHNFYGDDDDGSYKSPQSCRYLAEAMEEALHEKSGVVMLEGQDVSVDVKHAIWYLRWVADNCSGMDAWY